MKGFVINLESETTNNLDFRRVLYTAKHSQLVLMCLRPGEEIGEEVHALDQFFRFEAGSGQATLDDVAHEVRDGFGVMVPAGMKHNVINTGVEDLKFYTLYSPPEHQADTVRHTKAEAKAKPEQFDGKTSE